MQFSSVLSEIAGHWNVAIIAEGSPVNPAPVSVVPVLAPRATLEETINKVAVAFDYNVSKHDKVFILTKRFTRPDDIPDVTLEETRNSLSAIKGLISPLAPAYVTVAKDVDPRAVGLMRSLDAAQIQALSNSGVPVSSLSGVQRAEVFKFATSFYISEEANMADKCLAAIMAMIKHDPVFHWQRLGPQDEFGYDIAFAPKALFKPVSHPDTVFVSDNGAVARMTDHIHNGVPVEVPDATDPGPPHGSAAALDAADNASETLETVIARLNVLFHSTCAVDAIYAKKRVTVAGIQYRPAEQVLSGLAEAYGLTVRHTRDGTPIITHPDVPAGADIMRLASALKLAVPNTIVRAVAARLSTASQTERPELTTYKTIGDVMSAVQPVYIAALTDLRVLGEPVVRNSPTRSATLKQLGASGRNALAIAQSIQTFTRVLWLCDRPIPPYIADFDNIILTGSLKQVEGVSRFELHLSYLVV